MLIPNDAKCSNRRRRHVPRHARHRVGGTLEEVECDVVSANEGRTREGERTVAAEEAPVTRRRLTVDDVPGNLCAASLAVRPLPPCKEVCRALDGTCDGECFEIDEPHLEGDVVAPAVPVGNDERVDQDGKCCDETEADVARGPRVV